MQLASKFGYGHQHPFGMLIESRSFSSEAYAFGFNGKEKDDKVSGERNGWC